MGVTVPGGRYRRPDGALVDANGVPLQGEPRPAPSEPETPKSAAKPPAHKPKK